MKQRLCLGRCLINDPDLLILDEPSAGLDPRARIEFRDLLLALAAQGKAVFISSHILAELEELCSAVAIIEQGTLVATGTVEDVKERARQKSRSTSTKTATQCLVDIRLATPDETLPTILAEQAYLKVDRATTNQATVIMPADDAAISRLLKDLVNRNVPITHFAQRDHNLEDVFMHLTEGVVQ